MALKNILSILSFLFIAVACSMEDEVLPPTTGSTTAVEETAEVMVNVNLAFNGTSTKTVVDAGTAKPTTNVETKIHSAVVALVNSKEEIMMIRNWEDNSNNTLQDIKFLTKVKDDVKAIAIVNSKKSNEYLSCKTLTELNNVVEENARQDFLVKVGEKKDIFAGYTDGFLSTAGLETLNVEIPVTQLAARVDLMGLKYRVEEGSSNVSSVKIISAQLMNVNNYSNVYNVTSGTMSGQEVKRGTVNAPASTSSFSLTQDTWLRNDPDGEIGESLYSEYSYTNTSTDNPVKMRITYFVNEEEQKTVDVIISEGKVEAGYLYRLYVGLLVKNDKVSTEVVCYTNDWIKEDINIDITD